MPRQDKVLQKFIRVAARLIVFLALIAIVQESARLYISRLFKQQIQEKIPTGYVLDFQSIRLQWRKQSLEVKGFSLGQKTGQSKHFNSVELDLPTLSVKLASFLSAFKERKLIFSSIEVNHPIIRLEKLQPVNENFTVSSLQILDSISQYLSLLKIENLHIKGARFEHLNSYSPPTKKILFPDIDLEISGFSLDSTLSKHSFLNARQVNLQIRNQSFFLHQNKHLVQFDTLNLSTDQAHIIFSGLELFPLDSLDKTHDLLQVKAPKLSLEDIDFESSYLDQKLDIGVLQIQNPSIHFDNQVSSTPSDREDINTLKSTLSQFSNSLTIDKILLANADIDLNLQQTNEVEEVSFDIDSILIFDFFADSNTTFKDIDRLPFRDITLSLSNISQFVNPNVGTVYIKNAQLNSQEKSIELVELQIGSYDSTISNFIHQSPEIKLSGIDIFDVLLRGRAEMESIDLLEPFTKINFSPKDPDQARPDRNFYQTLASFFSDFFIKEVSTKDFIIRDGQVQLNPLLQVGAYNYRGSYIHLDKRAQDWTGIVPFFQLQLTDFSISPDSSLHISGDSLFANGETSEIFNLMVKKNDSSQEAVLQLPRIQLLGPVIDSFFSGRIIADTLFLEAPNIQISRNSKATGRTKMELPLQIPWIFINQGILDFSSKEEDRLQVNRFDLVFDYRDSLEILFSQFNELNYSTSQWSHQLSIKNGRQLDDGFSYELSDIQLQPQSGKSAQDSSILIPNLRIYDWQIAAWQKDSLLKIRKLIAEQPRTQLKLSTELIKKDTRTSNLQLNLDTLLIFNAQLNGYEPETHVQFSLPSVTLAAYDLNTQTKPISSQWYQELLLGFDEGIQFKTKDFELTTAPLFFNSDHNSFQTDSLLYQAQDSSGIYTSLLYQVDAHDWNIDQLLRNKHWQFSSLSVDSGFVYFFANEQKKKKRLQIPTLSSDLVKLNNINAIVGLDRDIHIKDWDLQIEGLQMDSLFDKKNLGQHYQSLSTSVKKVALDIDQAKNYHLEFATSYQSEPAEWQFTNIDLSKNLSNTDFAERLKYRTDYWDIKADKAQVNSFNLSQFFQEEWHIDQINIQGLQALDFNDETIPIKEAYKPLFPEDLKSIKQKFIIDSLSLNGDLSYTSIAPMTGEFSEISFQDINGNMTNLTNIPRYFDQELSLKATALLYDQAPLEVDIQFHLDQTPSTFELSGKLTNLDLTQLNPVLRPQAAIAVNKGVSSKMLFNFAANDSVAVGDLLFRYKKLRIQLLDKEDLSSSGFGNSILTFWTNQLIKSQNPSWLRRRKGTIFFKRDQMKAIPHYWANSILSGVVSSVGVKNTKRKLKKSQLNIDSFSYETLLKEQLKSEKKNQKDNL